MKYVLVILLCCTTVFADGINKKKKKRVPRKKAEAVKTVTATPKVPKTPPLLTTPDETLMVSIGLKPPEPLLDVPPEPLPVPITTSEIQTYPIETDDKGLSPWWFLLSATAIPFLINHGDEELLPIPTPTTTPVTITPFAGPSPTPELQPVPEPSLAWLGGALALGGVLLRRRIRTAP